MNRKTGLLILLLLQACSNPSRDPSKIWVDLDIHLAGPLVMQGESLPQDLRDLMLPMPNGDSSRFYIPRVRFVRDDLAGSAPWKVELASHGALDRMGELFGREPDLATLSARAAAAGTPDHIPEQVTRIVAPDQELLYSLPDLREMPGNAIKLVHLDGQSVEQIDTENNTVVFSSTEARMRLAEVAESLFRIHRPNDGDTLSVPIQVIYGYSLSGNPDTGSGNGENQTKSRKPGGNTRRNQEQLRTVKAQQQEFDRILDQQEIHTSELPRPETGNRNPQADLGRIRKLKDTNDSLITAITQLNSRILALKDSNLVGRKEVERLLGENNRLSGELTRLNTVLAEYEVTIQELVAKLDIKNRKYLYLASNKTAEKEKVTKRGKLPEKLERAQQGYEELRRLAVPLDMYKETTFVIGQDIKPKHVKIHTGHFKTGAAFSIDVNSLNETVLRILDPDAFWIEDYLVITYKK
jgi:hypothetical protein